jgi:hypothetical protein
VLIKTINQKCARIPSEPDSRHGCLDVYVLFIMHVHIKPLDTVFDRLCGLVVRVLGYRSGGPGSIPGTIRKKSSVSGTGSTQSREYN